MTAIQQIRRSLSTSLAVFLFLVAVPAIAQVLVAVPAIAQEKYSLPACSAPIAHTSTFGGSLKLVIPKGARKRSGSDVDYYYYDIAFGSKKDSPWLSGLFGPMATSGNPPKYMLDETVLFSREWAFGDVHGVDVKGSVADGHYWRYLGTYGEAVYYFDVPKDAANFFDKILDSICYAR
jgi:hypothetical protein